MSHKRELTSLGLRNVNRCSVRPADLITHRGYAVLVTDTKGWIGGGKEGFFFHQTRYLSHFGIKIDGAEPNLISANTVDHHFLTAYHFARSPAGSAAGATPEDESSRGGEIVRKGIELQINTFVGDGLHFDVILTNHALAPTSASVSLIFKADFVDLAEAQAGKRQQDGLVERVWSGADARNGHAAQGELAFHYMHPKLQLGVLLKIAGGDVLTDTGEAVACEVMLTPHVPRIIAVDLMPVFDGESIKPFFGQDGTFSQEARATEATSKMAAGLRNPDR